MSMLQERIDYYEAKIKAKEQAAVGEPFCRCHS